MILSVHVDDMLLTYQSIDDRRWFEQQMELKYRLTKQRDDVSYFGMTINRDPVTRNIHASHEVMIRHY